MVTARRTETARAMSSRGLKPKMKAAAAMLAQEMREEEKLKATEMREEWPTLEDEELARRAKEYMEEAGLGRQEQREGGGEEKKKSEYSTD